MNPNMPQYDFNDPVFRMNLKYRRWAREHLQLATLQSDVIHWNIAQTVSPLRIPIVYHVHYHFKSIVGIDENQNPVYGDHHILELSIPNQYPLEGCKIAMLTDVWHPNIRSEGNFKGRVCGNTDSFGLTYDLYQLVLRVGEILQYKNYHAIHTPPYPEDSKVAQWVIDFAEPNGIVDKTREIVVDDTPLLRILPASEPASTPTPTESTGLKPAPGPEPTARPTPPMQDPQPKPEKQAAPEPPPLLSEPDNPKIRIGALRHTAEQKQKITITPKD